MGRYNILKYVLNILSRAGYHMKYSTYLERQWMQSLCLSQSVCGWVKKTWEENTWKSPGTRPRGKGDFDVKHWTWKFFFAVLSFSVVGWAVCTPSHVNRVPVLTDLQTPERESLWKDHRILWQRKGKSGEAYPPNLSAVLLWTVGFNECALYKRFVRKSFFEMWVK